MFLENRSGRALLIIDMINDYAHIEGLNFVETSLDIIPFVQGELQYFRERMRPVIFCSMNLLSKNNSQSEGYEFRAQVIQELRPRTEEICLQKDRYNAFFNTNLAKVLLDLKVHNLTLAGVFSHSSILLTAASAVDHGFSVVVPEPCVCAPNENDQAAALRLLQGMQNNE